MSKTDVSQVVNTASGETDFDREEVGMTDRHQEDRDRASAAHPTMDAQHVDTRERQPVAMAVSNAMVRLYKEQFGRGPTKARAHFAGPDTLIATLEDTLTPAERGLVRMGEHQRLRDVRMFFQYASEEEFRTSVEEITGRKVRAFVSGIDVEQDVATEVFYLYPLEGPDGDSDSPRAS